MAIDDLIEEPFDQSDPLIRDLMLRSDGADGSDVLDRLLRLEAEADAVGFLIGSDSISADDRQESTAAMTNKSIGRYQIIRPIGQGAFGRVYEACLIDQPQQRVALKVLDKSNIQWPERLLLESRVLRSLEHPNLVSAIDFGVTSEEEPFLVMELVEGIPIDDFVIQKSLDYPEIAGIMSQAAAGLAYAHEHDILHRDIKVSNILVQGDGRPVVMDFGLARRLDRLKGQSLTESGTLVGTLGYLAPEQADWEGKEITRAADIYGLGATLYKLLTGRTPVDNSNAVRALKQLESGNITPPRKLVAGIPTDLENICLKCLRLAPHDRYGSMRDLADDLNRFVAGRPVIARPLRPDQRFVRWCRLNPTMAILTSCLFCSILIGLILTTILWRAADARNREANQLLETARVILKRGAITSQTLLPMTPGTLEYRHFWLQEIVDFLEALVENSPHDHELLREAATSQFRLGKVCLERDMPDEAINAFEIALRRFQNLAERSPADLTLFFDVFHSWLGLFHGHELIVYHHPQANECLAEADLLIEMLVSLDPDNPYYWDAWICTQRFKGFRFVRAGKTQEAQQIFEIAWSRAKELKASQPQPSQLWRHVGASALDIAQLNLEANHISEAEKWYQLARLHIQEFIEQAVSLPAELIDWYLVLDFQYLLEQAKGNDEVLPDLRRDQYEWLAELAQLYTDNREIQTHFEGIKQKVKEELGDVPWLEIP